MSTPQQSAQEIKSKTTAEDQAGTGFMINMTDALKKLEAKGYKENLGLKYDHFEANSGVVKLYPKDIRIDQIIRFENTSDPDDQSILYAISSIDENHKGVFVESYGLVHEDESHEMIEALKDHPH